MNEQDKINKSKIMSEEELKQFILKVIKEENASIAEILTPSINEEFGKIF